MARTRLLKPTFFKNDKLGECSPLARIVFASLWCMADRDGKLENRPKIIKIEAIPYDDANIDNLLDELSHGGFIKRYEADGYNIIHIINFLKHQRPHPSEPKSIYPDLHNENNVVTKPHDEAINPPEKKCAIVPSPFNPSPNTLTLPPSGGLKENVLGRKGRNSITLKTSTFEQAREILPRADLYALESDWRGKQAEYPNNPDNAFLGFCRGYAKNHPDLARRDKWDS